MASPAAQSIHQRYSAGDCTLSLSLQPSALSQWYPKPIVDTVQFELWTRTGNETEPVLVAEGDRTDLQMIALHVEHRTRTALALVGRDRTTEDQLPPLPLGCHLPQPLSYLQLCDLSAIFTQYEQATVTLPVTLELTQDSVQAARTAYASSNQTPPAPAAQKRRGILVPFRSARRTMWASSAAVALFAVGLTAVLLNRTPLSETSSVADSSLSEPDSTGPDGLRLNRSGDSELSATLPRDGANPDSANPNAKPGISNRVRVSSPTPPRPSGSAAPASPSKPSNSSQSADAPLVTPEDLITENSGANSAPAAGSSPPNQSSGRGSAGSSTAPSAAAPPAPANAQTARRSDSDANRESGSAAISQTSPQRSEAALPDAYSQSDAAINPAPIQRGQADPQLETQAEAETVAQVRNYFLNQWSPDPALKAPLSYNLQLSASGEVVGFSALTELGNAYRDRLLPNSNLSFPAASGPLSNGLALTLTVSPDGQVQVQKQ